jgi:NitT/TauT family transport system substrate-binding protein
MRASERIEGRRPSLTRGHALQRIGTSLGAVAACAGLGATPAFAARERAGSNRTVRIGWTGAICEAATFAACDAGFFAREGVAVELVKLQDSAEAIDAIASGKIDATAGLLYAWLEPIARGLDVQLSAGLHGGCVRLVAAKDSGITQIESVKGATIATDRIGGPAMDFFSSLLYKRGIDPENDVRWRAYPPAEFGAAIESGDAHVLAAGDPDAYRLVLGGKAVSITDRLSAGIFFCDQGIAHSHNCFTVLRGDLVRSNPRAAAALTWGWSGATRWVRSNLADAARLTAARISTGGDAAETAQYLASYGWHPSADLALEEIELTARDFKRAGLLGPGIDPLALAERAYADVYKAVDA